MVRGKGEQPDAYEQLVEALKRVIVMIVDERVAEQVGPVVEAEVARVQTPRRWATVAQAAEQLGIGQAAVRQRIKRAQLEARTLDGRIYIDMEAHARRLDELLP